MGPQRWSRAGRETFGSATESRGPESCTGPVVEKEGEVNGGRFRQLPARGNAWAQALQIARDHIDGTYACIIQQDGRTVGDFTGFHEPEPDGNAEYRAQYAYACGYHD